MQFNANDLNQLLGIIWESVLGLTIQPDTDGAIIPEAGPTMAACIHITGAWNGAVILDCPVLIAQLAAAQMFNTGKEQVTLTDRQDALAELVNMIGGNLKALLPETCYLSLPTIIDSERYLVSVPGGATINRIEFGCEGHVVTIAILESVPEPVAASTGATRR